MSKKSKAYAAATEKVDKSKLYSPLEAVELAKETSSKNTDSTVEVDVPVKFINEDRAPGIKRGGVLNVVRHEVVLVCKADAIPEHLEADLTGLDVGDSLHISAIKLPAGVKPTIDRDFTVATIVAPSGLKSEEAATTAEAPAAEAKA